MKCLALLIFTLFLIGEPVLWGQSTDATISGIVFDPSSKAIANAQVLILNEATGVRYPGATNAEGLYTVPILPPGQYRVQVSKDGFKTIIKPGIILNVQSALVLNFTLPVGAASESITVDAGTSLLNTTDASVSTVVDRQFVENIPLNGRSFQDLISMVPGVVTQSPQSGSTLGANGDFSVNGQRTESNNYMVDGVTGNTNPGTGYGGFGAGTSGSLGGATALGTTQSLISVDGLQEFRVQTSTYSAEFGRSPGGQFSLVTRSGSDEFHGEVFDYLRNNFFDANDWFNDHYGESIQALRQNDFGGTLGGPIQFGKYKADQSFFFLSYEGLRLTQPQAATIQYVPDLFMRQESPSSMQGILDSFPVPNGLDYGNAENPSLAEFIKAYSSPSSINSTSVRADHSFGSALSVFARVGYTPSTTSSRNDFAVNTTQARVTTATLGATSQFGHQISNELRLGYNSTESDVTDKLDSFGGAAPTNVASALGAGAVSRPDSLIELSIDGVGTTNLIAASNVHNKGQQWNVVDTFRLHTGHHQLSFGVDYRRIASPSSPPDVQTALFFSSQSVLSSTADLLVTRNFTPASPIFKEFSAFAQDEWRPTSRLNLSLGLRWELNPPPTEAHGNSAYTLLGSVYEPSSLAIAPKGTPLWKTTWYNLAPRLGIAWTARQSAGWETVLRTGGGVFFDTNNQVAANGYEGIGFEASGLNFEAPIPSPAATFNQTPTTTAPYTSDVIYAFPGHLQLPYTLQWNVSLEQALGKHNAFTVSYIGADGRRLTGEQELSLTPFNPSFGTVFYFNGGVTSNYQALQSQFQRTLNHGLQVLTSYTWSHSLDYGSTSTALPFQRGNSDFDVRDSFQGGLSWELPRFTTHEALARLYDGWALDGRVVARSGFPITLGGNQTIDPGTGNTYSGGLNVVPLKPVYLHGSQYPGGRAINSAAFSTPIGNVEGNAPRNFVRGFADSQINLAVRKQFHIRAGFDIQFRAETFNVLNHPNFGYVDPVYSDANFGQATQMLNQSLGTMASQYQQGGPRSMQFALKILF